VVDHLLYLLVEEGIPRLEGGTRLVGRAASHLQGLETRIISNKQPWGISGDARIAPGRMAAGGGRRKGIPGAPGGNGGRPEVRQ
jgi:hypothetical protein